MIWNSWKRTLLGSMFMVCGTAQLVSGIIFSLIFKSFLRNASNVWTGIFNLILGTALISPCNKHSSLICMFSVTILLNVSNLILLEFAKISKANSTQSRKDTNYLTYLLTAIPSAITIFVAVFVGSYIFCRRIMKKQSSLQKQDNRNSIYENTSYYNWVFKESESWPSNSYYYDDATNSNDEHLEENSSNLETNSANKSEHMLTFNTSNKTLNVIPMVHKGDSSIVRYQSLSKKHSSRVRLSELNETFFLPYGNLENQKIKKTKSFTTPKKNNNDKPYLDIQRSNSDANYRPLIKYFSKSNSDLHLNSIVKPSLFPTSLPKPFDNDSLINLKQLELLARQWRFQAQHKALRRQFSFQVVNKRYSTNL